MLFGLPPRKRNFYRPKTSGKMGGRLTIQDPIIGEYMIERSDEVKNGAATCYTPDGEQHEEQWLIDQLKGMTNETYESIFSFSALDLKGFRQMKAEDLGEVLLGIGLTGSAEIYTIERSLDSKLDSLFKPNGKNPTINQQLNKLDSIFGSLHTFSSNEATYRKKQLEKTTLASEITHLHEELNEAKDEILMIEKKQHALPMISEYQHLSEELLKYPREINFPTNGIERLQKLKERQLPLTSDLANIKSNINETKLKISKLHEQVLTEKTYENASQVINQKQHYYENKSKRNKYKEEIKNKDFQLNDRLQELNIPLSIKDLEFLTFPFHIEQTWGDLRNNTERLEFEKEQHQLEYVSLNNQRNALVKELRLIKDKVLPEEQLQDLQSTLKLSDQSDYEQQVSMKQVDQQKQWKKTKMNKQKRMKNIFISTIPISIMTTLAAIFSKTPTLYIFSVIILLLGIGQWLWGIRSMKETEEILFLKRPDEQPKVQLSTQERQNIDQLIAAHHKNKQDYSLITTQLKSVDVQLIKWNEKKAALKQQTLRLDEQIEDEISNYSFLSEVDCLYWPELFYMLKELIKEKQEQLYLETEYEAIERKQSNYEASIHEVIQQFVNNEQSQSVANKLNDLEKRMEQHRYATRLIEQHKSELENNKKQLKERKQKLATYEEAIVSLFTIAEVTNEEDFYKRAKQLEAKQLIKERLKKTHHQLAMVFPQTVKEELINDKLDEQTLEISHQQLKKKIAEIEKGLKQKNEQLTKLIVDINNLESSESHSETRHQFNMEQEHLRELVHEWSVLKTAKEMLARTKQTYRNKYLKQVIETTSTYFSMLTNGAYKQVFAPTDDKLFQVEAATDVRYHVNELSEGTMDQLYVSLRIAISEMMSEQHQLPFIIDDAFVHFDARRTKQVMKLLTDISKRQQVILFTCKKEVAESVPAHDVIKLEKVQHAI